MLSASQIDWRVEPVFRMARSEYQKAIQAMPNNSRVRMNLALAYYKVGRLAEAVRELAVLHEREPLEVQPALLLADCLLQTGQAHPAVELLAGVEKESPDDRAVICMLGMALLLACCSSGKGNGDSEHLGWEFPFQDSRNRHNVEVAALVVEGGGQGTVAVPGRGAFFSAVGRNRSQREC